MWSILKDLYTMNACHCKCCTSVVFICFKFKMASNLTKVYRLILTKWNRFNSLRRNTIVGISFS